MNRPYMRNHYINRITDGFFTGKEGREMPFLESSGAGESYPEENEIATPAYGGGSQ